MKLLYTLIILLLSCSTEHPIYLVHHSSFVLGKSVPTSTRIQVLDVSVHNDSIFFTSIDVDKNIKKIGFDCSKISTIRNQTTNEEYQGCDSLGDN